MTRSSRATGWGEHVFIALDPGELEGVNGDDHALYAITGGIPPDTEALPLKLLTWPIIKSHRKSDEIKRYVT